MRPVVVFDYDGTLHETLRIYRPAVEAAVRWLRDSCGRFTEPPSEARIAGWLGMNTSEMWEDFMPDLEPELRQKAGKLVGAQMMTALQAGKAAWYAGTEELLDGLKAAGYELAVLSNCGLSYARAHWDHFGMERWFTAFFASETWGDAPKSEILREIAADFETAVKKTPVRREAGAGKSGGSAEARAVVAVVGDRGSDLAAAHAVGVPFFGCLYGYGSREELAAASAFAACPAELRGLIPAVAGRI